MNNIKDKINDLNISVAKVNTYLFQKSIDTQID